MSPDQLFIALGLAIRRRRENLKLSQERFADDNGMSASYYGKIERGDHNLTLWNYFRIAEGLNVSAWQLLKEAENLDLHKALQRPHRPPQVGRPPGRRSGY